MSRSAPVAVDGGRLPRAAEAHVGSVGSDRPSEHSDKKATPMAAKKRSPSLKNEEDPTTRRHSSTPTAPKSPLVRVFSMFSKKGEEEFVLEEAVSTTAGDLVTFGWNSNGQLGCDDASHHHLLPVFVNALRSKGCVELALGSRVTVALLESGQVYSWGRGDEGALGHGTLAISREPKIVDKLLEPISHISCRGAHVAAVSVTGKLYMWGKNDDGQLGLGYRAGFYAPDQCWPAPVQHLLNVRVTAVACGRQHTMALTEPGRVFTWGCGDDGQLGHGSYTSLVDPTVVTGLADGGIRSISCGSRHSLAIDERGGLWCWGWGHYGQLGLGHSNTTTAPQRVVSQHVMKAVCGYRHTVVLTDHNEVYTWGWGKDGQLGLGNYDNRDTPGMVVTLQNRAVDIAAGGRHTLAVTRDKDLWTTYVWGRGDDGQLGSGHTGSCALPQSVEAIEGQRVIALGAGWGHSAVVLEAKPELSIQTGLKGNDLVVRGDLDGFFGQFMTCLLQLMLIKQAMVSSCGFTDVMAESIVLAGTMMSILLGNLCYWFQGRRLRSKTGSSSVTSLPHGPNVMIVLAFTYLIMAPAYQTAKTKGDPDPARHALRLGLVSNFIFSGFEIVLIIFVQTVSHFIPRSAMLSALAGTAITFITMPLAFQIYESPASALVPLLVILVAFGAELRFPLGVPGAFVSMLSGITLAWILVGLGQYSFPGDPYVFGFYPPIPIPQDTFYYIASSEGWQNVAVIFPFAILNTVGNLANLESASSVGDTFNTVVTLLIDALVTMVSSIFGNPFPTTIFIGHPAYKTMGAKTGYLLINAFACTVLVLFNGVSLFLTFCPIEACVGILLWIGVVITASAFEGFEDNKKRGLAVAFGFVPCLAAWGFGLVTSTLSVAGIRLIDIPHTSWTGGGMFVWGMAAMSQGYLLISLYSSAMMAYIVDREFLKAAGWTTVACVLSMFGLVHAYKVTEDGVQSVFGFLPTVGSKQFSAVYALMTLLLALLDLWVCEEGWRVRVRRSLDVVRRCVPCWKRRERTASVSSSIVVTEEREPLLNSPSLNHS